MKYLICALGLMVLVSMAGTALAETASWTGNPEPDVEAYTIYVCEGAGCVVQRTPAMRRGTAPHVGAGVTHSYAVDLTGKEGALAVTAKDFSQNESGLSLSVSFDKASPSIPARPTLQ